MICGDIGMASSVCYQLFLYRAELQRRRQQPELRQQTKIELTHGLITKCVEKMKDFTLSELQALSREVDFRKLMEQQLSKLKTIQSSLAAGYERRQQSRGGAANILTHQMVTVQQRQRQQQQTIWPQQSNWPRPMQPPQRSPTPPPQTHFPPPPSPSLSLPHPSQVFYAQHSSYALHLQMEQCVVWEASPSPYNYYQQHNFMWQEQQHSWTSWYQSVPTFWNGAVQPPWGASQPRGGQASYGHWTHNRGNGQQQWQQQETPPNWHTGF